MANSACLSNSKVLGKSYKPYVVLGTIQKLEMKAFFKKSPYPSKHEISEMANKYSLSEEKIRNWFKHQRKNQVNRGSMKYIKKNSFSKQQSSFLEKCFLKNANPTSDAIKTLAQSLDCQTKNITNWFAYRRKLLRHKKKPFQSKKETPLIKTESEENKKCFNRSPPSNPQIHPSNNQNFPPNLQNPIMGSIPIGIQQMNNYVNSNQNYQINLLRINQMQNYINKMKYFSNLNYLMQLSSQMPVSTYRWNY